MFKRYGSVGICITEDLTKFVQEVQVICIISRGSGADPGEGVDGGLATPLTFKPHPPLRPDAFTFKSFI